MSQEQIQRLYDYEQMLLEIAGEIATAWRKHANDPYYWTHPPYPDPAILWHRIRVLRNIRTQDRLEGLRGPDLEFVRNILR